MARRLNFIFELLVAFLRRWQWSIHRPPSAHHEAYRRRRLTRRVRRYLKLGAFVGAPLIALTVLVVTPSNAAVPTNFQTSLVVGDGLDGPSGFDIAPDGRIFVLERAGKIKIIKNGQLLPTPFADLPSEPTGDRGLIGIAFDPDFGVTNNFVYFYYTGHDLLNHLVRFDASLDVGQEGPFPLFTTSSPSQLLHVGGSIAFGPDGKLYFAIGDNGNGANAQDLSSPHGKILRINKDGTIPTDNPFYGQPGKLGAIWAYGFRNPWRFQFDKATGQLYGGDVGDFTWEEINHIVKGGNYGWPVHEGPCNCPGQGFIDPIHYWNHDGASSAVTGGPVYRGSMFPPEYQGSLFFGDYAQGWITVIMALREAPHPSRITIYSDSAYIVNGMNRAWWSNWHTNGWRNAQGKPVKNRKLWEAILDAVDLHDEVEWVHVPGHAEDGSDHAKYNTKVDQLAVEAKLDAIAGEAKLERSESA